MSGIYQQWTEERLHDFAMRWERGDRTRDMAAHFQTSAGAISNRARSMGLEPRRRGRQPRYDGDVSPSTASAGRRRHKMHAGSKDRYGTSRVVLPDHHPASRGGSTIFARSVKPALEVKNVLKDGMNSAKIGGLVAVGKLKGAPIFTLTLEERNTCPRTCAMWAACYGNNMHYAERIHDDGGLIGRLGAELRAIARKHPVFLVRLHVLGDFYSTDYVAFWRWAMTYFRGLHVFGFTSRRPPDPIGIAIAELTRDFYDRFRMRFSGLDEVEDGSMVIQEAAQAVGIVCPAQGDDEDKCCATCAICWSSNRTISFFQH